MGYTAIIIIALYFTYRIGIFDMIKNCLPTKLGLLRIKTKIEAPMHVVTYNAAVQALLTNDVPKNRRVKIQHTRI